MMGEIDLYGVFVPTLAVLMILTFAISLPVRRGLRACGVYRFVWHPPLFDLALYVILLGGAVALAARTLP